MGQTEPEGLGEALNELDLYLVDALPPLLVADAIEILMASPPETVAEHLLEWVQAKRVTDPKEVAERVVGAVTRMGRLGALQLISNRDFNEFVSRLEPALLRACPLEARLRLQRLLHEQVSNAPDQAGEGADQSRDQRFFSPAGRPETVAGNQMVSDSFTSRLLPLLEKLADSIAGSQLSGSLAVSQEVMSQLIAAVTRTAETAQQLEERLDRLKDLGLDVEVPKILKNLGQSLPDWALVPRLPAAQTETKTGDSGSPATYSDTRLEAMKRIVELGKSPDESSERFGVMLETAVEQFNQGFLGRAVSILESAEQVMRDEKVPLPRARSAWDRVQEKIRWHRLGDCLSDPVQHAVLARFVSFFPALAPRKLLEQLKSSADRSGRRLLVGLLQIHGVRARSDILAAVESEVRLARSGAVADWDFLRDTLGLLSSPPRPAEVAAEDLELLDQLADLPLPLAAFRELVRLATQVPSDQAAGVLMRLLDRESAGEEIAERDRSTAAQWNVLFEQILTCLAGVDDPQTRRSVLDHCLDRPTSAGVSTAPLAALGTLDLSWDPGSRSRLLAALKQQLRPGLFAWIRKPKDHPALDLVRALSGTPSKEVRSTLAKVAGRFPDRSFGLAAQQALTPAAPDEAVAEAATTVPASPDQSRASQPGAGSAELHKSESVMMEGELGVSSLPNLLQHFANSDVTGVLELLDPKGESHASMVLVEGGVLTCRLGRLEGKDALYTILEKPLAGRFRLSKLSTAREVENLSGGGKPLPLVLVLLEGLRRYDEYRQSCLMVPDDTRLTATGRRPTAPEGEDQEDFMRTVWEKATSGATALQCEIEILADPYRVRRLLAHWLAEQSLQEQQGGKSSDQS